MLLKFLRERRGSVLPTFAIAALPLVAATGAAVDYSRAYAQRTAVQDALDAAVLAAGKKIGLMDDDALKAEASNFYVANVKDNIPDYPEMHTTIGTQTITGTANLSVQTYFLGVVGLNYINFNVIAKATLAMGTLEVALVLDNSTSMSTNDNIATLRTAATNLVGTLYNLGKTSTKTDPVKVGIVPFGASVNVGSDAAWVDKAGKATYAGDAQKTEGAASSLNPYSYFGTLKDSDGNAITWGGCVEERPDPYNTTDEPASASASPSAEEAKTLFLPMFAPDEPDNWTCSTSSCNFAGTTSSTRRYNGAPTGSQSYNNYLPDAGDATTCAMTFTNVTVSKASPGVFTTTSNHGLSVGTKIVLQTTGSLYSGLTEGQTYYVKAVPTSKTFTLSTTSGGSAINTSGSQSGTHSFILDSKADDWTCSNGNDKCAASGSPGSGRSERKALAGINLSGSPQCKYGTAGNKATVANVTVSGMSAGPNYMCTTKAITDLTTTKDTVTGAIADEKANGYTNITAGVMWGWRLLSPGAPFTQGRAYTDNENQKIIILMTDGDNTYNPYTDLTRSPGSYSGKWVKSAYGAWGYMYRNRFGTTSTDTATVFTALNVYTASACAHAKTAGIRIYTVAFTGSGGMSDATKTMLENCASDTNKYFVAADQAGLLAAFSAIGDDISLLRVAQ